MIRGLSLHQPWATWIREREKTIETRPWRTNYRGWLLICSTKMPKVAGHLHGYALCVARLVTVRLMTPADVLAACCPWERGRYAWILQEIIGIPAFRVRGRQRLWRLSPIEVARFRAHTVHACVEAEP